MRKVEGVELRWMCLKGIDNVSAGLIMLLLIAALTCYLQSA